ncbi:MAG TPA: 2-oxoglutarate dehydrogenase E1 component, partial [Xanthobacteraceae bacterium]|nr:2-oxoglutarate dehydrogenase E1 component [Xanthobacteraceae bacterium]
MGNQAQNFIPEITDQDGPQPGPSWASPRWPLFDDGGDDDLTQALDPTAMKLVVKDASAKAGRLVDEETIERAAGDSIRAMMLVRTYRVRGHLAADLDPLGLSQQEIPADLTPEYHGFAGEALDRPVYLGGTLGLEWATVRELVGILRKNYCGHVGIEYMHIADVEE